MSARIYRPAKNAMQSGRANTRRWRLEFNPEAARHADPLMGWTSLTGTKTQLRLEFDSQEEAVAYAEKHGIEYRVYAPRERTMKIKAYADNFAHNRVI